jgi:hypothetical protein
MKPIQFKGCCYQWFLNRSKQHCDAVIAMRSRPRGQSLARDAFQSSGAMSSRLPARTRAHHVYPSCLVRFRIPSDQGQFTAENAEEAQRITETLVIPLRLLCVLCVSAVNQLSQIEQSKQIPPHYKSLSTF